MLTMDLLGAPRPSSIYRTRGASYSTLLSLAPLYSTPRSTSDHMGSLIEPYTVYQTLLYLARFFHI